MGHSKSHVSAYYHYYSQVIVFVTAYVPSIDALLITTTRYANNGCYHRHRKVLLRLITGTEKNFMEKVFIKISRTPGYGGKVICQRMGRT